MCAQHLTVTCTDIGPATLAMPSESEGSVKEAALTPRVFDVVTYCHSGDRPCASWLMPAGRARGGEGGKRRTREERFAEGLSNASKVDA